MSKSGYVIPGCKRVLQVPAAALLLVVPCLLSCGMSWAISSNNDSSSGTSSADNSVVLPGGALKGGVQKIELNLSKLRDVGLDLKHLIKAMSSLYDEVTTQPVTLITEPSIVGPGIIINIPVGTQAAGPPEPARKDRVDLAMNTIKPMIGLFKQNVDEFMSGHKELDLPPDVLSQLHPETEVWIQDVNVLSNELAKLNELTARPPYDNGAIAGLTAEMERQVKQLDENRRKIYKVIRKEGKRIAASEQPTQ